VALIVPTALWAIPFYDVAMAILRRRLTGRSIYETDRNHLHHRLLGRGWGGRGTVALIGLFSAVTASAAVVSVYLRNELLALSTVLAVILLLAIGRVFGHQELYLLAQRLRNLFRSLISTRRRDPVPTYARMQGSREWIELWQTLIDFAERFDVSSVQMNLNMPMIAEEFHADWIRKERPIEAELWHSDFPLKVDARTVGRLRVTGRSPDGSVCAWMGDLIAGLRPFETQLSDMLAEHLTGAECQKQKKVSGARCQVSDEVKVSGRRSQVAEAQEMAGVTDHVSADLETELLRDLPPSPRSSVPEFPRPLTSET
jgi:UDP-GlcNAc:undecaprenyl-phosphate GlcNAc-1-phosphate transferase